MSISLVPQGISGRISYPLSQEISDRLEILVKEPLASLSVAQFHPNLVGGGESLLASEEPGSGEELGPMERRGGLASMASCEV